MSSLEGNKIAAAILVGGMITLSVGIVTDFIYRPNLGAQAAHEGGAEGEGGGAPAAKPAPLAPVLGLIAGADVAKGEAVAQKCASCHTFTTDGKNKVGPGLYGVVGRAAGTHPGFAYSESMKAHAKPWTFADLNHFIARPKQYLPGTKMAYPGLPNVQDRANLFAWMSQQSATPAPLPTPEEIAAEQAALQSEQAPAEGAPVAEGEAAAPAEGAAPAVGEQAAAPVVDQPTAAVPAEGEQTATAPAAAAPTEDAAPAESEQVAAAAPTGDSAVALIAAADPAAGEKAAAKCKACHDMTQAAKNKVGPALWGVVGRNRASVEGYKYSDALTGLAGAPWTFEELDKYLANPKGYAPGTKMAFPGLKKPEERAALLRWLNDQSDSPAPLPQ
jgi:cytochrome c